MAKMKQARLIADLSQQEELLRELFGRDGNVAVNEPCQEALELGLIKQSVESVLWCSELQGAFAEIEETKRQMAQLEVDIESLEPWLDSDVPTGLTETKSCDVLWGTLPPKLDLQQLESDFAALGECLLFKVAANRSRQLVVLVMPKDKRGALEVALLEKGFEEVVLPKLSVPPKEGASELKKRSEAQERKREELVAALRERTGQGGKLKKGVDPLALPEKMLEAAEKAVNTKGTFVLDVGIRAKAERDFGKMLSKFNCAWEIEGAVEDTAAREGFFARLWRRIWRRKAN